MGPHYQDTELVHKKIKKEEAYVAPIGLWKQYLKEKRLRGVVGGADAVFGGRRDFIASIVRPN